MLDLNQAETQRPDGVIPDGTYAKVVVHLRGGGYRGPELPECDQNLLRQSKTPGSDVRMLDCEFTVLTGPNEKRKFWQLFTVAGGKTDDKGQSSGGMISRRTIRGMAESTHNVRPDDTSPAANAKRSFPGYSAIHGWEFACRIGVEDGGDYPDKNNLAHVVTPDEPEYVAIMAGQEVPPKPSRTRSRSGNNSRAAPETVPAWQQQARPAAAQQPWSSPHAGTATQLPNGSDVPQQPAEPGVAPAKAGPNWLNG